MKLIKHSIALFCVVVLNLILMPIIFADTTIRTIPSTASNAQQINDKNTHGEYVRKRFLQIMKKPFDMDDQKRKILIIGDSHAQDFLNSIAENNLLTNSQIRTRYIPTRCQIFLGAKSNRKWIKEDIGLCEKSDKLELAKTQIANADVIILAAMWRKWTTIQLPQTLANLKISPEQKIFVIGRRSFSSVHKKNNVLLSKDILRAIRKEVDIHQIEINKLMIKTLDQRIFINTHKLVCGSGTNCPVYTDRFKMITLDGGHLSQDGARFLGDILFGRSQLSALIQ